MNITIKVHDPEQNDTYNVHFKCFQQNPELEQLDYQTSFRGTCGVCGDDFGNEPVSTDELLTVDYNLLSTEQRFAAIEAARRAGEQFANDDEEPFECDCAEPHMPHTCPDDVTFCPAIVRASDYLTAVVEPAHQQDVIDMNAARFNLDDYRGDDPRVAAFVKAANERYQERADEAGIELREERRETEPGTCPNCGLIHPDNAEECGPADENGPAWYR
jgi:hypothetical protein